jgi:tryptophan synthase beta subunit
MQLVLLVPLQHGLKTLKEAVDSAFGAYMGDPVTQFYAIGGAVECSGIIAVGLCRC